MKRSGKLNSSEFGKRMSGKTELWQLAVKMFDLHYKRLGFVESKANEKVEENPEPTQARLFD